MKTALRVFVLLFGVLSAVSIAQTAAPQPPKPESQASQPSAPSGGAAEQLAAASKEAAAPEQKDENAQFRESPSMKWFARKFHLSLPVAYGIAVGLNFLVVVWTMDLIFRRKGLAFMGLEPLPKARREYNQAIRKQMDDAQRQSEEANRRLREIEGKLAQIGNEIASFQSEAATQQRNEESAFKATIEEERQRILVTARQEIESASTNALRELRAHAAELAVSLAEKKIQVDSSTDQVLVRDFVDQLGKDGQ